jgi:predicted GNAT family N-acyltransferase
MNITAIICDYASNTKDICAIRYEVFVDEQNVPVDLEIDGLDGKAKHALAFVDGVPIGTGRILNDGHIGRVAVLKNYRGLGIGKLIMKELIKCAQDMSLEKIWLSSQWHAHSFYLDFGFVCVGEIYKEAGIDHIKMFKAV